MSTYPALKSRKSTVLRVNEGGLLPSRSPACLLHCQTASTPCLCAHCLSLSSSLISSCRSCAAAAALPLRARTRSLARRAPLHSPPPPPCVLHAPLLPTTTQRAPQPPHAASSLYTHTSIQCSLDLAPSSPRTLLPFNLPFAPSQTPTLAMSRCTAPYPLRDVPFAEELISTAR